MQCDVFTMDKKPSGKVELSEDVFGIEVRRDLLHRAVKWQLAKRQCQIRHWQNASGGKEQKARVAAECLRYLP